MKFLVPGTLVLALLGTVGYFPGVGKSENTTASSPASRTGESDAAPTFVLARIGSDEVCIVRHTPTSTRSELKLDSDCALLVPYLADARIWEERGDGTVAFVSDSGETLVEFFAGDGLTYESLRPQTPILSMYRPD